MVDFIEHGAGDKGQEGGHLVETAVVVAKDEERLEALLVQTQVQTLEYVGDSRVTEYADEGEAVQVYRQEGTHVQIHQEFESTQELQDREQGQEGRGYQVLVPVLAEGYQDIDAS